MAYSLNSSWAKIRRAKEHRDVLEKYIRETFSVTANYPGVGFKHDTKTGQYVCYVSEMPDQAPFDRVSLILGDTFHNLRSSLDHLAWQFALQNTGGTPQHEVDVQFPITVKPSNWPRMARRHLREINPKHHAVFERFQPYNGGDIPLSLGFLREFSNSDKHRLLTPVVIPRNGGFVMKLYLSRFRIRVGRYIVKEVEMQEVSQLALGTEIMRFKLVDDRYRSMVKTDAKVHVPVDVTLTQGRPILGLIDQVAASVVQVIREFEPLL